jgi:hypothetical protein
MSFLQAFRNPGKAYAYALRKAKTLFFWKKYCSLLPEPKILSAVPHQNPGVQARVITELQKHDIPLGDFTIDTQAYQKFLAQATYERFPAYYAGNKRKHLHEKSLEHYLAAKLLDLQHEDIYIDVASSNSPAPTIYRELFGCTVYRQDLSYPDGISGNVIGGDAAHMPIRNDFATKMALHCSFEHFEQNADVEFIKEAGRVLRGGGKLCILPLYLFTDYAIQTDPVVISKNNLPFERDTTIYCAKGWGNRHGRFYDVLHLTNRLLKNAHDLALTIYVVQNEKEVDPSCYVKFIALFEKMSTSKGRQSNE